MAALISLVKDEDYISNDGLSTRLHIHLSYPFTVLAGERINERNELLRKQSTQSVYVPLHMHEEIATAIVDFFKNRYGLEAGVTGWKHIPPDKEEGISYDIADVLIRGTQPERIAQLNAAYDARSTDFINEQVERHLRGALGIARRVPPAKPPGQSP